jgi:DNA-binding PadR family transcriptional regulator
VRTGAEQGWRACQADREEIVDGRLRRYYRLTPSGADALAAETARMRSNAAVATRRLRKLAST